MKENKFVKTPDELQHVKTQRFEEQGTNDHAVMHAGSVVGTMNTGAKKIQKTSEKNGGEEQFGMHSEKRSGPVYDSYSVQEDLDNIRNGKYNQNPDENYAAAKRVMIAEFANQITLNPADRKMLAAIVSHNQPGETEQVVAPPQNEKKSYTGTEFTESFKKEPQFMDSFTVFSETAAGKSFLEMFEPGGVLEGHKLLFDSKGLGKGTFGNTALKINENGKIVFYEKQIISRETRFVIQIDLSPKEFDKWNKNGKILTSDVTIGHEVFVHGEKMADLLKEFEQIKKISDDVEFSKKRVELAEKLSPYKDPYTEDEIKKTEENARQQHASMLDPGTTYVLYIEQLKEDISKDPDMDEKVKKEKLATIESHMKFEEEDRNKNKK